VSKEARPLKRIDAPLKLDPVQPVRGSGISRRTLLRSVHGLEFLRRDPARLVHGVEFQRRDPAPPVRALEFLRHAPEFLPLDPERQRKERRYAL
jgi:hypothetical protein